MADREWTNDGFELTEGLQNPWAGELWPARPVRGRWEEFRWRTSFQFWSWRDKWRAIWSILRLGRVSFSVALNVRNEGNVTFLDAPSIQQDQEAP